MIYLITKQDIPETNEIKITDLKNTLSGLEWGDSYGLDIETEGLDPYQDKILTIQIGNGVNQIIVDCQTIPIIVFKEFLEDYTRKFIIHNAKFDAKFLMAEGITLHRIFDTYLAESVIHKGDKITKKSLGALVKKYFNVELNKEIRNKIVKEGLTERVIKYCADDVKYLPELADAQSEILERYKLMDSLMLENAFVRVLAYTELCGIYLDKNRWRIKMIEDRSNYNSARDILNQWIITNNITKYIDAQKDLFSDTPQCTVNWKSPKQVAAVFKDIGIDTSVIDSETGEIKSSVDSRTLHGQQHELINLYLEFKKHEKIISTYGDTFLEVINPITDRIHTNFNQIMTTGRLSSGGKTTVNLQNIPADTRTRSCFVAQDEEYTLVNIDYSGQEARILANFSQDGVLLKFYNSDTGSGDIHSLVASKIFPELRSIPLPEIKKNHPDKRQIAKSAGFAISYGGNGETIARNLGIPIEDGNKFYESYWEEFGGVKSYMEKVKEDAFNKGYIQFNEVTKSKTFIYFFSDYKLLEKKVSTPYFWQVYREEKEKNSELYTNELKPLVRLYFKRKGEIERMAMNFTIQGTGAEMIKLACIYLFSYLEIHDLLTEVYISNIVHDELLLEVPNERAEELAQVAKECMEKAAYQFCKVIKVPAEPKIVDWWGH